MKITFEMNLKAELKDGFLFRRADAVWLGLLNKLLYSWFIVPLKSE